MSDKRWRARSRDGGADAGSDDGEEGLESGDCDDEDECSGVSGLGPPPRRKRLRIFAGWALSGRHTRAWSENEALRPHRLHHMKKCCPLELLTK